MTIYPIIIPTLNRYDHFKECVESLSKNTHADKTELIIGLDYPPDKQYEQGWQAIKEYIPKINGFGKVTVFQHRENLGPAKNTQTLSKYALSKYDAYICTEDDNVFSPCFLDYINKGLERYKNDNTILAISGYMQPVNFGDIPNGGTVMRLKSYPAWGIGIWKRSRIEIDTVMQDHYMKYVCSHRRLLLKMKTHLRSLYQLIFWTKYNPLLDRKCDFTIGCYQIINNKYTIVPIQSLVRNMGYDGSGENCGSLEKNIFAKQIISQDIRFEINDRLTPEDNKQLIEKWEKWRCDNPTFHFDSEKKKRVLRYYRAYMYLGYYLAECFIKIYHYCKYNKSHIVMVLTHPRYIAGWLKRKILNQQHH